MGFVFIFLILLVILTTLMSTLVQRYLPEPAVVLPRRGSGKRRSLPPVSAGADQGKLVAVISAAIRQHRSGAED
jgi:oxaloacetate decarboxylase gamma subunit